MQINQHVKIMKAPKNQGFIPIQLNHPRVQGLAGFAGKILSDYGNPSTEIGKVAALCDWVSRYCIHPDVRFHPNGSSANTATLPAGETWATFNTMATANANADNAYWPTISVCDGLKYLEKFLGTFNTGTGLFVPDGANPGLLTPIAGAYQAQYRINSLATYKTIQCTYETAILQHLVGAIGIVSMVGGLQAHDPILMFLPSQGGWIYGVDPTFNEYYTLGAGTRAVSVLEMVAQARAGTSSNLTRQRVAKPGWDTQFWNPLGYFSGGGIGTMTLGHLRNDIAGRTNRGADGDRRYGIASPELDAYSVGFIADPLQTPRVSTKILLQDVGVGIYGVVNSTVGTSFNLASNWAGHVGFQKSINGGASWTAIGSSDTLRYGQGSVQYRSVDALGFHGLDAIVTA